MIARQTCVVPLLSPVGALRDVFIKEEIKVSKNLISL